MKKNIVGERIITPKARLSFSNLYAPDKYGSETQPMYKATLLFDKADKVVMAGLKEMKKACLKLADDAFGTTEKIKLPFKDGNEKSYDGYANCVYIIAKSKYRPGIVGPNPNVEIPDDGQVYGGCYVRAALVPFSYDQGGNKGISLRLGNLQKIADGEPFSGSKVAASSDFDTVETDEKAPFDDAGEDDLGF